MKFLIAVFAFLLILQPVAALAQPKPPMARAKAGEITARPICSYLTNRSDINIRGTIYTMPQKAPDGTMARLSSNFELKPGERRHFCASGPFYEDLRLELVLRTLIPMFSCYTRIDREIFIEAPRNEDGVRKYAASCY